MLVIGNPPYSAWQENFNNQNANRHILKLTIESKKLTSNKARHKIKSVSTICTRVFIAGQVTALIKMELLPLLRTVRFLNSRAFDGFRKVVSNEFSHIYIVDLGGNIRNNPKLSGTTHNVFGDSNGGVAIALWSKPKRRAKPLHRFFTQDTTNFELATEKLDFLRSKNFPLSHFERIQPDKKNNWLNITDNDWDDLFPVD